jgi:murein DD-endopeptidase MepM/ murein hydrolase activator NlpD
VRLGAAVLALVLVAAVAAVLRGGGGGAADPQRAAEREGVRVTPATRATAALATPASPTATPSLAATVPAVVTPAETATPEATAAATVTPTATATPAAAPVPASIELRPQRVGTGETLLVVAQPGDAGAAASSARLDFRGGSYTLQPDGGRFWGVFALPLTAAFGPETLTVTLLDGDGAVLVALDAAYEVIDLGRAIDYLTLTPEQASVLTPEASAREAELRGEQFAEFDREARWSGPFAVPVPGPLTSAFGVGRSFNGAPVSGFHGGADYGGADGSPVLAPAPGRVSWAGEMPIRGNTVLLDHGGGVKTGYHHLSRVDVEAGAEVSAGTQLGAIGSTGLVTGPHLHWELTIWGVGVDPVTWLAEAFLPAVVDLPEPPATEEDGG